MTQAASQTANCRAQDKKVGVLARWLLPSIGSLALLLTLQLLIIDARRFLQDSDAGWHIRTGELIIKNRHVPRTDPFSHTMFGREWFAWEWLTDVLMAGLHNWRGLAGVVGGAILILATSFAALFELMRRRGADPLLACALTVFGAMLTIAHWLARPHLLSILWMIVWVAAIESFRRHRTRWIYFVPLLVALWANLHGAFVITFVVLAIYAVGEAIEFAARGAWWSNECRRVLKTYALVGALSALASLLTPYGYRLHVHLWSYLNDKQLLAQIGEYQSPNFHTFDGKLIEILLVLGAIAAVNAFRQRRFVESGLFLLWAHLALQSERHITLAVVFLMPIIAEQLTGLLAGVVDAAAQGSETRAKTVRAARGWYRQTMRINAQLNGALVYALLLIFLLWLPGSSGAEKWLAPRFNARDFPVGAADFIAPQQPPGNMFARDQFGGYLIYRLYPQTKVFVDGRNDFYRQGTVLDDMEVISNVRPGWREMLSKYDVQWMVLKRNEPLAQIAVLSGQWLQSYADQTAEVLIKKSNAAVP
jgi:hypothetical protein